MRNRKPAIVTIYNGPSIFSTDLGKSKPRAVDLSDKENLPASIVRTNFDDDIHEYIQYLRGKFPHECSGIFAPWDMRDYFDHHDSIVLGEEFCYTVLSRMQKHNEQALVDFCRSWESANAGPWLPILLTSDATNIQSMFHVSDIQTWGGYFLQECSNMLRATYYRTLASVQSEASKTAYSYASYDVQQHQSENARSRKSGSERIVVLGPGQYASRFNSVYEPSVFHREEVETDLLEYYKQRKDSAMATETKHTHTPDSMHPSSRRSSSSDVQQKDSSLNDVPALPLIPEKEPGFVAKYGGQAIELQPFRGYDSSHLALTVAIPAPNSSMASHLPHPGVPALIPGPIPGMNPIGHLSNAYGQQERGSAKESGRQAGSEASHALSTQKGNHNGQTHHASSPHGRLPQRNAPETGSTASFPDPVSAANRSSVSPYSQHRHWRNSRTNSLGSEQRPRPGQTGPSNQGSSLQSKKPSRISVQSQSNANQSDTPRNESQASNNERREMPSLVDSTTEVFIPRRRNDIDQLFVKNWNQLPVQEIIDTLREIEPSVSNTGRVPGSHHYATLENPGAFFIRVENTKCCRRLLASRIGENRSQEHRFRLLVPFKYLSKEYLDARLSDRQSDRRPRSSGGQHQFDQVPGTENADDAKPIPQTAVKYSAQDARSSLTGVSHDKMSATAETSQLRPEKHEKRQSSTDRSSARVEKTAATSQSKSSSTTVLSWANVAAAGLRKASTPLNRAMPRSPQAKESAADANVSSQLDAKKFPGFVVPNTDLSAKADKARRDTSEGRNLETGAADSDPILPSNIQDSGSAGLGACTFDGDSHMGPGRGESSTGDYKGLPSSLALYDNDGLSSNIDGAIKESLSENSNAQKLVGLRSDRKEFFCSLFGTIYTHTIFAEKMLWYREAQRLKKYSDGLQTAIDAGPESENIAYLLQALNELRSRITVRHQQGTFSPPPGATEFVDQQASFSSRTPPAKDVAEKKFQNFKQDSAGERQSFPDNGDNAGIHEVRVITEVQAHDKSKKTPLVSVSAALYEDRGLSGGLRSSQRDVGDGTGSKTIERIRDLGSGGVSRAFSSLGPHVADAHLAADDAKDEASASSVPCDDSQIVVTERKDLAGTVGHSLKLECQTEDSGSPNSFVTANNTPEIKSTSYAGKDGLDQTPTRKSVPALPRRPPPKSVRSSIQTVSESDGSETMVESTSAGSSPVDLKSQGGRTTIGIAGASKFSTARSGLPAPNVLD